MPDKNGKFADVVLGYRQSGRLYQSNYRTCPYFGALIGRYGNRIGGGKFTLDGQTYTLPTNNDHGNTLHGGLKGFDKVVWTAAKARRRRRTARDWC